MIQIDNFTFYNADCLEIMKTFSDKQFDLAIVDPPYGINIAYDPRGVMITNRKTKNGLYSTLAKEKWDNKPDLSYFKELFRVSKNQIIFGAQFFTEFLPPKQCWIVWDKMNGDSSFSDCELAFTSFDTGLRIFRQYTDKKNRIHICQKPINLYDSIIKKYAKNCQSILDTHLGSASIALAVDKVNKLDNMNLSLTGIELDSDYFNAAIDRFRKNRTPAVLPFL